MWTIVLCAVAVLVVYYTYWINKWRNPACNGVLPPGSMGLPIIGETLELIVPSYSLDLHHFIKKRIQSFRYGPIFRTNILGRPAVVSADPEINRYILQNEGKLVEVWYMDTFSKLFAQSGESRTNASGIIHKYARSLTLTHFGSENLKERLLPQVENIVSKSLQMWSSDPSVDVKAALSIAVCDFTAKQLFGYDAENSSEKFTKVIDVFISWPLNIPGTTYHKCLKDKDSTLSVLRNTLKERVNSPAESRRGDFLDQIIADMDKEKFLTEDFTVNLIFAILFASFESISAALTLSLKLIGDHPSVLEELTVEHEAILKNRENPDSPLTWAEYNNSMTFTLQVINETLRLGNVAPGLLRRALQDMQVEGYTIPAGWVIMVVNSALHLNPATFKDPLEFNPWRWKDFDSYTVSKNLMPFGGGRRQCAGSEFTKLFMAIFLHKLVTKYRWNIIKQGNIGRNPIMGFGDGIHISFSPKDK
ncbi:cucurbitadienol 11-hydroxylase [Populus alba]|uniref:cucurbitadienol 11-hydroxylase n=1 Tax=Populus alba TaxID=43335 RepID=UPI003CC7847E